MNLTISEIVQACSGRFVPCGEDGDGSRQVSCVVIDSRQVQPGGVFVAVEGERVDGHKFVSQVFEQGAALAVVEKGPEQVEALTVVEKNPEQVEALAVVEKDPKQVEETPGSSAGGWGSYVLVKDTLRALRDIAEAYRRKLSIKVVGITGSVGKTSTKEFIAGVLARKYKVLKTEGNLNNEIGVPLTLLRIRPEHEAAVVEMGISDFGEMHELSRMARPDICVMTNIGQSHLNNLKDRDGILRAKSEIFDYMAEDGEICLNAEDDKLRALKEIRGHKPHFFGMGKSALEEVSVVDIVGRGLSGSDGVLRTGGGEFEIHIPLPGLHMALNAAAAACVAGLMGLTGEETAAGIGSVRAVSGRTNILPLSRNTIIDDCYNANPASVHAALDLLALAHTEKVAVLGDMLNLGEDSHRYHEEVGAHAAQSGVGHLICVGEESRHICRGAAASARKIERVSHFPDVEALVEALERNLGVMVPEGSTVLVKASHDMGFAKVLDFLRRVSKDSES